MSDEHDKHEELDGETHSINSEHDSIHLLMH